MDIAHSLWFLPKKKNVEHVFIYMTGEHVEAPWNIYINGKRDWYMIAQFDIDSSLQGCYIPSALTHSPLGDLNEISDK